MFRTVSLSIIRSFSLYTRQWYMPYRFAGRLWAGSGGCEQDQDGTPSWSCSQPVNKPVWHIPLMCVHWKTPDDGQRNCLKHVEFYSKKKFEYLLHLVVFIIRIYHDARSPERQISYSFRLLMWPSSGRHSMFTTYFHTPMCICWFSPPYLIAKCTVMDHLQCSKAWFDCIANFSGLPRHSPHPPPFLYQSIFLWNITT